MQIAVIRADASPSIGGGHIARCLVLADVLICNGWTVSFAGTRETRETIRALASSGHRWIELDRPHDPSSLKSAIGGDGCNLLIVDHYQLGADYESACRGFAKFIAVIDDLGGREHNCDLLIDPMLGRGAAFHRPHLYGDAHVVTGPSYALVRDDFAVLRTRGITRNRPLRRVLLSMGTTNAGLQLAPLVEAISRLNIDFDVVVGSAARDLEAVRAAVNLGGGRLHVDLTGMAALMSDADAAVLAAGTTTWEAACLGLPMVLMVTAANQNPVAQAMQSASAAVIAENVDDAARRIAAWIRDNAVPAALSKAAASICDGLGAQRVSILINPERDRAGHRVTLRPVCMNDADWILEWQQHPETRRFARNPAVPSEAEHRTWLASKIQSSQSILSVVLRDDEPAGILRLDWIGDREALEISIVTKPGVYRQGIASAALRLARRLVPKFRLLGQVLPGNTASYDLFVKAGFRVLPDGWFILEPPCPSFR